jgi:glycosyltransferase involved in cell wall biosynthesis
MQISVIICTHNPRPDYLERTLAALKAQTMPTSEWELLLIDNASEEALEKRWDLSWHPNARHIFEPELGLTMARLRGISESTCDVLVFVDDDNLLNCDYLAVSKKITEDHPTIAAFGGSSIAEYEVPPPHNIRKYCDMMTVRTVVESRWSNNPDDFSSTPIGAGMVVTRALGIHYLSEIQNNPLRKKLDRCGTSLASGGDIDLALMACDIGCGKGTFKDLVLLHLIPKRRTDLDYLLRLQSSIASSIVLRRFLRGESKAQLTAQLTPSLPRQAINAVRAIYSTKIERLMRNAWNVGLQTGLANLETIA